MSESVVETSRGALRGVPTAHGAAFLGVPYAAAPVGSLRFVGPVAHERWDGTRDASVLAPPMPQPPRDLPGLEGRPFMGTGWSGADPVLELNVWTPDPSASGLPVMVWFHGGAFVAGSPSATGYDGTAFARDGVVLVSASYRLGAEGFCLLEGGEANVALRDQLFALAWVRDEIAAFGGDPARVTAFGQSAGAMCLGGLLASPSARGLFARAILQSGSGQLTFSPAQALKVTHVLAEKLGVAPTREAFLQVPFGDLTDAQAQLVPGTFDVATEDEPDPMGGALAFVPVRDGQIVPRDPLAAVAAGTGAGVPLLIGDTLEEGNFYVASFPELDIASAQPITDGIFRQPVAAYADAHRSSGAATWRYEFGWRSGAFGGRLGAAHAVELPFVFDTLDAPGLVGDGGLLGPGGGPQELADRMHAAWVRFAADGDPGWAREAVEPFA